MPDLPATVATRIGATASARRSWWAHRQEASRPIEAHPASTTTTDPAAPASAGRAAAAPAEGGTFVSLRIPAYRRLWLAGTCTFFAVPMQAVARGYLAFQLTGTNTALGIVFLGFGVPMLLATPFGGVAADRLSKRLVLVASQGLLALSAALVTVALYTDRLAFWMLVASGVLQGLAFSFVGPARLAFSAELVGRARLVNAILLAQLSMNGSRVVGPAMAGALLGVTLVGPKGLYLVVTVVLVAAVGLTATLPAGRSTERDGNGSAFADILEGVRYVTHRRDVLVPVLMSLGVVMTAFPFVAFLPSLVEDVFDRGAGWLGALSSASAVGAVVASLAIARRQRSRVADRSVAIAGLVFGAGVIVLGLAPTIGAALVVVAVVGAGNAAFQSLNNSLVLLRTDDALHGRVQSLLMLGFSGFGIFAAPLGAVADAVGLRTTLVGMGTAACLIVVGLGLVARPRT